MNRKERRAARKTGQAGGLSQSFSSQLRDIGDRHAQASDVAQGESLYRQALAGDPDDIVTLHRLGHLATRTGRIDDAFTLFSRAIGINRNVPELHMGLAAACHAARADAECKDRTSQRAHRPAGRRTAPRAALACDDQSAHADR